MLLGKLKKMNQRHIQYLPYMWCDKRLGVGMLNSGDVDAHPEEIWDLRGAMELTRFKTTIKTLPARFGQALYVLFEMFCEVIGILAFCAPDNLPLKAYSKWPGRCKQDLGHVRDSSA